MVICKVYTKHLVLNSELRDYDKFKTEREGDRKHG